MSMSISGGRHHVAISIKQCFSLSQDEGTRYKLRAVQVKVSDRSQNEISAWAGVFIFIDHWLVSCDNSNGNHL
jgi:hypothetical protein